MGEVDGYRIHFMFLKVKENLDLRGLKPKEKMAVARMIISEIDLTKKDMAEISKEEWDKYDDWVINQGLTLEKLMDYVIERNGIIGVGLITLGDYLKDYVLSKEKLT